MSERSTPKVGDRVTWRWSGGRAEGRVVEIAREPGTIKGFHYKASQDDPRWIVETDDGRRAAHKADALEPDRGGPGRGDRG
ncbi:MAG TPA: DUF2945 domain-containing protein [Burkholderiaceae bacterium]|nr:DUF2945 domain-containing protein [Burkholderiaceae bacterium]